MASGSTSHSTTFSNDPFDCLNELAVTTKANSSTTSNIRNVKPLIQPKPSIGSSSFYSSTGTFVPSTNSTRFDDTLSNGKNLIKPLSVNMPTIIKPISSKGKAPQSEAFNDIRNTDNCLSLQSNDESFDDMLPSQPMPSIPPPPLPDLKELDDDDDEEKDSYAIVMYDFDSDVDEDLNLKVSTIFNASKLNFINN